MLKTRKSPEKNKKLAVIQSRQEIVTLRQEVETLRKELRRSQKLASIGTLATMVAHEYNNILTPVINYAQMAQKRPEFTEKALSKAVSGGLRAAGITRALLGLAGDSAESNQPFSIVELVNDTLSAMAREPQRDSIEFNCLVPNDLKLSCPRIELQQVLLNLLLNARHAVMQKKAGRRIEVSAQVEPKAVHLMVSDNGGGISRAHLPRIFEPFFTTKKGSPGHEEGNGLGLAVCREIMHSMNGEISVQSKVGRGTTFTLKLIQAA